MGYDQLSFNFLSHLIIKTPCFLSVLVRDVSYDRPSACVQNTTVFYFALASWPVAVFEYSVQ